MRLVIVNNLKDHFIKYRIFGIVISYVNKYYFFNGQMLCSFILTFLLVSANLYGHFIKLF
jgi:hypothetical protein